MPGVHKRVQMTLSAPLQAPLTHSVRNKKNEMEN